MRVVVLAKAGLRLRHVHLDRRLDPLVELLALEALGAGGVDRAENCAVEREAVVSADVF